MSRFGVKIVIAMMLITVIPLLVSVFLVDQIVKVSDSVAAGQLTRLAAPLNQAGEAYRNLFAARKDVFKLRAQLIAMDQQLSRAMQRQLQKGDASAVESRAGELLAQIEGLGDIRVLDSKGNSVSYKQQRARFPQPGYRDLELTRPLVGGVGRVRMTFFTPMAPFRDFQALGKAQDSAIAIADIRPELSQSYQTAFLIMFGAALLVASIFGWAIARRTVRRVGVLAAATRQVATGDLEARVAFRTKDEIGQLGNAFNDMVSQLKENRDQISYLEKIGAWQEIARRLAHEIKNPLTPIQLSVQQLHRKYEGDDAGFQQTLNDARDIVTEEVEGLRRLVGEFSAFAKLPSVDPEPVALAALLDDFLRSHSDLAERAKVEWQQPSTDFWVSADRMLIKHVLYNLVENAYQAAEQLGDTSKLVVNISVAEADDTFVRLLLKDNGPGIPAEVLGRVFDPYYTTKEHGTGLGLAIVKKIILEHKGRIVVSADAEGTVFQITLPRVPAAP